MEKINTNELINIDLAHVWHPCSAAKDFETLQPIVVKQAEGAMIEATDGRRFIDANSSWWCKLLGHGHPALRRALIDQAESLEHVMLADATHEAVIALSARLAQLSPSLDRVSYAGDGACAVEMAMKMSLQSRQLQGEAGREHFIALSNGYHGETLGALAVTGVTYFRQPFTAWLSDKTHFIENLPYVTGIDDPLWDDCSSVWPSIEAQLAPYAQSATAIVLEPIVQGAGGMLIYSADLLRRLRAWADAHGVHLIADEILTGLGRTGTMLGCQHADIEPDFLCLGKGLTGGWLPLSAVITRNTIYDVFYDDYEQGKTFFHSHTYAGNPLATRVALACLSVLDDEAVVPGVSILADRMQSHVRGIAERTGCLKNVRSIGAVVAADLQLDSGLSRPGYAVFRQALELGALLRPLGNTLYWVPPLNTPLSVIDQLAEITEQAILRVKTDCKN